MVQAISKQTGVPKWDVLVILETYFVEVKEAVLSGESVSIRHFGTFTTQLRKAKTGRNLQANTPLVIPDRYIPIFRPAREFLMIIKKIQLGK